MLLGAQRDLEQDNRRLHEGRHWVQGARRPTVCCDPSPSRSPRRAARGGGGTRGGSGGGDCAGRFDWSASCAAAPSESGPHSCSGGAAAPASAGRPYPGPGLAAPPGGAQDPEAAKSAAHDRRWPVPQHTLSAQAELRTNDGSLDGELRVRDQRDGVRSN